MVGELVPQGTLHLPGEQLSVVAEVAFERVPVDDDPVFIALVGDSVAEVVAIGMSLGAAIGDDDGDLFQDSLEFVGKGVDRVDDQGFEPVHFAAAGHRTVKDGLPAHRPPPSQPRRHSRAAGDWGLGSVAVLVRLLFGFFDPAFGFRLAFFDPLLGFLLGFFDRFLCLRLALFDPALGVVLALFDAFLGRFFGFL
jgi:hypothetical protein